MQCIVSQPRLAGLWGIAISLPAKRCTMNLSPRHALWNLLLGKFFVWFSRSLVIASIFPSLWQSWFHNITGICLYFNCFAVDNQSNKIKWLSLPQPGLFSLISTYRRPWISLQVWIVSLLTMKKDKNYEIKWNRVKTEENWWKWVKTIKNGSKNPWKPSENGSKSVKTRQNGSQWVGKIIMCVQSWK